MKECIVAQLFVVCFMYEFEKTVKSAELAVMSLERS